MNLKFWDKHKVIAVVTGIAAICFIVIANMSSVMEENAWETAADRVSREEAEAILEYYRIYEEELPAAYYPLDSLSTIILYIIFFGVVYSAWSALDIPERYQKEEKAAPPQIERDKLE